MATQSTHQNGPAATNFPLAISIEALRPLIEEILRSVNGLPGWPLGKVALEEKEAADCIGVKPHVLRDARLRRKLPYTQVGRTITYTAEQLKLALDRMSANA